YLIKHFLLLALCAIAKYLIKLLLALYIKPPEAAPYSSLFVGLVKHSKIDKFRHAGLLCITRNIISRNNKVGQLANSLKFMIIKKLAFPLFNYVICDVFPEFMLFTGFFRRLFATRHNKAGR